MFYTPRADPWILRHITYHISHSVDSTQKFKYTHYMIFVMFYGDVIMGAIASQIAGLMIVYSTVYSGADQIIHQSSASLDFVRGIPRWPVTSPHKWPGTRKMFSFDDVIMEAQLWCLQHPSTQILEPQCRVSNADEADYPFVGYFDGFYLYTELKKSHVDVDVCASLCYQSAF